MKKIIALGIIILLNISLINFSLLQINVVEAAATGHILPFPVGEKATVTSTLNSHGNQVDFDIWNNGSVSSIGYLSASKNGTIKYASDSSNDRCIMVNGKYVYYNNQDVICPWTAGNLVVIEHSPSEYSYYLHLEHNSIPERFKIANAQVNAGEIIGKEGNTGFTSTEGTGIHLHFMVGDTASGAVPWDNSPIEVEFTNGTDVISKFNMTRSNYTNLGSTSSACTPPTNSDWVITTNCEVTTSISTAHNVLVQGAGKLTIKNNAVLDIDFLNKKLEVQPTATVIIESLGRIH